MAHCILFFLGLAILWVASKTADEIHQIALATAAIFPLSWGYCSAPSLWQCLGGIIIVCAYEIYVSYS